MEPLIELNGEGTGFYIRPKSKIFQNRSKYQNIEVYEHDIFGKIMRLDETFQTSEFDEFLYHEPLVHAPLLLHNSPQKILIIGGGDGGSLKEVLKYECIKKVTLVELDEEVIKVSKTYLNSINRDSFDNSRVKILIDDGINFIKNTKETFDVIILDLTDPDNNSSKLYSKDFYVDLSTHLNPKGIISLHIGSPIFNRQLFLEAFQNLKDSFKQVYLTSRFIPIYGTELVFAVCSNSNINKNNISDKSIFDKIKSLNPNFFNFYAQNLFWTRQDLFETKLLIREDD